MIKEYIAYLKDNPNGYWFKRKLYGWGWVPVSREGWLVTLVFIIFILWTGINLGEAGEPGRSDLIIFFVKFILAIALLMIVCYRKGEKPKWQWGLPKNEK